MNRGSESPETWTIKKPFDAHVHLRDHNALSHTVAATAQQCWGAIVMPNLTPPVRTVEDAEAYAQRIQAARGGASFQPFISLYLTQETSAEHVAAAAEHGLLAYKLYPSGVTTNSQAGPSDLRSMDDVFAAMAKHNIVLQIHGETPDASVDIFDREARFIDEYLAPLVWRHPTLRIVFEHITTEEAAQFVQEASQRVAATITPHHLLLDRNALFHGNKIQPHHFCLPVLKRSRHRQALVDAATSEDASFFMGSDSAPHSIKTKECGAGCAGIFNAYSLIELYAMAFDEAEQLHRLESFCSLRGPQYYGLTPPAGQTISITRTTQSIPDALDFGSEKVIPLFADQEVPFSVSSSSKI